MKEELITFETAKLAKEKGFNVPVLYAFDDEDGLLTSSYVKDVFHPINYNSSGYKCSKPTQSLLQKWLRDVHKIYVRPFESRTFDNTLEYCCTVNGTHINHGVKDKPINRFESYEEALEAGLKEAFKLIKT